MFVNRTRKAVEIPKLGILSSVIWIQTWTQNSGTKFEFTLLKLKFWVQESVLKSKNAHEGSHFFQTCLEHALRWFQLLITPSPPCTFQIVFLHTTTNSYNLQYLCQLDESTCRSNNSPCTLYHRVLDFWFRRRVPLFPLYELDMKKKPAPSSEVFDTEIRTVFVSGMFYWNLEYVMRKLKHLNQTLCQNI